MTIKRKDQSSVAKPKRASSAGSTSTTSSTKRGLKRSATHESELARDLNALKSLPPIDLDEVHGITPMQTRRRHIPVVTAVVDQFHIWRFDWWMNRRMNQQAKIEISKLGDTSGKEAHGGL